MTIPKSAKAGFTEARDSTGSTRIAREGGARGRAAASRADIIDCGRGLIGRPFVFAGRSARGLDCVGVPLWIARTLGVAGWERFWSDPECHGYARVRGPGVLRAKLDQFCTEALLRRIDVNRLRPGDFVLCLVGFGRDQHVSLVTGRSSILHATNRPLPSRTSAGQRRRNAGEGRVVEQAITPAMLKSFMCGYQFSEVE